MFHGNAAVERSFSINKECLVENLLNDSLIAQRVVYDSVSSAGGVAAVPIPKALILAVRNASAKRKEAAQKKKDNEDATANHLKRVGEEIKHLEAKKARVEQAAKDETEALNDELKKLRGALKKWAELSELWIILLVFFISNLVDYSVYNSGVYLFEMLWSADLRLSHILTLYESHIVMVVNVFNAFVKCQSFIDIFLSVLLEFYDWVDI